MKLLFSFGLGHKKGKNDGKPEQCLDSSVPHYLKHQATIHSQDTGKLATFIPITSEQNSAFTFLSETIVYSAKLKQCPY